MGETPRSHFDDFLPAGSASEGPMPPAALVNEYHRVVDLLLKWAQLQEAAGASRRSVHSEYHVDLDAALPRYVPLVSHSQAWRVLLSHRLSKSGEAAEHLHEAADVAIENAATRVILHDCRLPDVSAVEVLKRLRSETAHRAPIALTFLSSALDEYEETFLTSVLACHLPALIRTARQKNAEQRIEQLLQAVAPADPLAEYQVRMAEDTAALRDEFLRRVAVLTSSEVSARAGFKTKNAYQTVHRWRSANKIFAIKHGGQDLYPDFQFGFDGYPLAIVGEVLALFARDPARTDWDIALWFAAANGWLDGKSPRDLLAKAPEKVKDAAEQEVLPDGG